MKVGVTQEGYLRISITCREQRELKRLMRESENPDSDSFMCDYMEQLTANSEYEWVRPEWCGDLTDAPMLGILGEETPLPEGVDQVFYNVVGHWDDTTWYTPVLYRWAWMGYMLESLIGRLADKREVILEGGKL